MLVQIGFILGLIGICGVIYGFMEVVQDERETKKQLTKRGQKNV